MDRLIEQHLEEYLRGSLEPARRAEFEKRLAASDDYTRKTVAGFAGHSSLIQQALRPPADLDPTPGFYARVMQRIDAQRVTAWWAAFLEPAFSRRLAYASLTLLVLLGVTMFSTSQDDGITAAISSSSAAEVLALPASDSVADADQEQAQGRDVILVDLATYQE